MSYKTIAKLIPIYGVLVLFLMYYITHQSIPVLPTDTLQIATEAHRDANVFVYEHGTPTQIYFERFDNELQIKLGEFVTTSNTWQIDNESAFFATTSVYPNTISGTTVLYGHNSQNVFARIYKLQPGDVVEIKTDTQKIYSYQMREYQKVLPENISVFQYDTPHQLALITCEGLFNTYRRIVYFDLVEVHASK